MRLVHKKGTIRWKGREVFITGVLRRERIRLLPAPVEAFQVYFGEMCPGILEKRNVNIEPKQTVLAPNAEE